MSALPMASYRRARLDCRAMGEVISSSPSSMSMRNILAGSLRGPRPPAGDCKRMLEEDFLALERCSLLSLTDPSLKLGVLGLAGLRRSSMCSAFSASGRTTAPKILRFVRDESPGDTIGEAGDELGEAVEGASSTSSTARGLGNGSSMPGAVRGRSAHAGGSAAGTGAAATDFGECTKTVVVSTTGADTSKAMGDGARATGTPIGLASGAASSGLQRARWGRYQDATEGRLRKGTAVGASRTAAMAGAGAAAGGAVMGLNFGTIQEPTEGKCRKATSVVCSRTRAGARAAKVSRLMYGRKLNSAMCRTVSSQAPSKASSRTCCSCSAA
mmetsp:Transcript_128271/g.411026  ORF Transcript_128271/g.411026 Transcript_128271/m.411026 type:complete len:328 (+) Transcript_128271:590-1573(+)